MNRASLKKFAPLAIVAGALSTFGCGESTSDDNEGLRILSDGGIEQIAFISRPERTDVGDVFQYTSFNVDNGGAQILKLSAVSGSAEPEAITPFGDGDWPKADIMAMDVSFDGQEIVFSARLEGESSYDLYRIKIDGTNPEEPGKRGPALVHTGPYDSVFPLYLPNDRIFFMTNETSAPGVRQFRDEYERGVTAQAATVDKHGGDVKFGPRNLSHRVSPTLVSVGDEGRGQILHTNWDHVVEVNEGNLMVMNPDMTGGAEFFGKEGSGVSNSYLKARQVNQDKYLAIATSREDTFQAGAIILIDKGKNEADASAEILTPDVPLGEEPSFDQIGRYYDAFPITGGDQELTHVLTSWADGPVQSGVASGEGEEGEDYGAGSGPPDFGIYILDPKTNRRLPLYNDTRKWDVLPMAIGSSRPVPTSPAGATADTPDGTALIGALNVLESSLSNAPESGVFRVRVLEGFSTEEGIPMDFGLTEAEGAILLGEAPVEWQTDHSFAAFVPMDRPIHLQTLDQFGMSMVNEDRWFSAADGEARMCGGCHEERGGTQLADPGIADAVGRGPDDFSLPYDDRAGDLNGDYVAMVNKIIFEDDPTFADADRLKGVPWNTAVQSVFDSAGCIDCHEGTPGPANPTVSVTDTMSDNPMAVEWTFNLTGEMVDGAQFGEMVGDYTASHISVLIMSGMMNEPGVEVTTDPNQPYQAYMVPQSARDSILIKYIQPEQVYPTHEAGNLAFTGEVKWNDQPYEAQHPNENTPGYAGQRPLTTAEKYLLILVADAGAQYYSLENAPGQDEEYPE